MLHALVAVPTHLDPALYAERRPPSDAGSSQQAKGATEAELRHVAVVWAEEARTAVGAQSACLLLLDPTSGALGTVTLASSALSMTVLRGAVVRTDASVAWPPVSTAAAAARTTTAPDSA